MTIGLIHKTSKPFLFVNEEKRRKQTKAKSKNQTHTQKKKKHVGLSSKGNLLKIHAPKRVNFAKLSK